MTGSGAAAARAVVDPVRAPEPPAEAVRIFGDQLPAAQAYADLLADEGVRWGLLGPREGERIWARHLLNSAVVAELIPRGVQILDIGSGAGLPGIPLALVRPDLDVVLVDSLLRRSTFLTAAVERLALSPRVQVVRSRAEDLGPRWRSPVVVARAVAPLERLAAWCLPLVAPGGALLALRGAGAAEELAAAAPVLARLRSGAAAVLHCGEDVLAVPTTVVRIHAA